MSTFVNLAFTPSTFLAPGDKRPTLGTRIAFSEGKRSLAGTVIGYSQQDSVIVFLDPCFHTADAYMPACVVCVLSIFADTDLLVRILPAR